MNLVLTWSYVWLLKYLAKSCEGRNLGQSIADDSCTCIYHAESKQTELECVGSEWQCSE